MLRLQAEEDILRARLLHARPAADVCVGVDLNLYERVHIFVAERACIVAVVISHSLSVIPTTTRPSPRGPRSAAGVRFAWRLCPPRRCQGGRSRHPS